MFFAALRPLSELRVSHGMRTVNVFGQRQVVSSIPLNRLQDYVTFSCFSRRDKRVMREEIARKRVLLVMGYPSADEIKAYYKRAALGHVASEERTKFEARLIVKP